MKQANDNPNTYRVRVSFVKQGGKIAEGTAVARKGGQTLVQYRITNGEARERWIPAKRLLQVHEGDRELLPRYKAASCKATKFAEPVSHEDRGGIDTLCEKCGWKHDLQWRTEKIRHELTTEEADAMEADRTTWHSPRRSALDGSGSSIGRHYKGDRSEFEQGEHWIEELTWHDGLASRKLEDVLVD